MTTTQTRIQDMPELQELLKLSEKERKEAAEILLITDRELLKEFKTFWTLWVCVRRVPERLLRNEKISN